MQKKILKKKAEGIIKREASESKFKEEHREKALEKVKEAIEKGEVRRFQDLKNTVKTTLTEIANEEDINYYE